MSTEAINREGNPIANGAENIRATVKGAVREGLSGVFPKNRQWHVGDYDLVFVIQKGFGERGGFYSGANMVVLTPEGDFRSGLVSQQVEHGYSEWVFRDAKLDPASDLEVVRFGPQLVANLLEQIKSELQGQEDPEKIAKVVNFLVKNTDLYIRMLEVSRVALEGMGEVDPELSFRDTGRPNISEEVRQFAEAFERQQPGFKIVREPDLGKLGQEKAAIDLFMRKGELMNEVREIASNMRADAVESWLKNVAAKMTDSGIFPGSWQDAEGIIWAGDRAPYAGLMTNLYPIYSRGKHGLRFWSWSKERVREFEVKQGSFFEEHACAEHLLEQASVILERVINLSARQFFPRIKTS